MFGDTVDDFQGVDDSVLAQQEQLAQDAIDETTIAEIPDMEKAVFDTPEEDTTIPATVSEAIDEQDTETLDALAETPTTTTVPTQTVTQALTGIGTEGTTGIGSTADVKTAITNTVQTEDAKDIVEEANVEDGVSESLLDAVVKEEQTVTVPEPDNPIADVKVTPEEVEQIKTNTDVEEKVFEGETLQSEPTTEVKDETPTDVFDNVVDVEFEDITDQQAIDVDTDPEVVTTDQITDETVTPELITTDVTPEALTTDVTTDVEPDTLVTTDVAPDTDVTTDQQVVVTTDLPFEEEEVDIGVVGDDVEVEVADSESDSEVVTPEEAPFECPDGYDTVKQADGTYMCIKKGTKMTGRRRIATNPYLSSRGFAGPSPYGPTIKTVGTTVDSVPATKKAS